MQTPRARLIPSLLLVLAPLAGSVSAQREGNVWTVDDDGPADFAEIEEAAIAAAPGDRLLVKSGVYPGFTVLGKTLVIEAAAGADVRIEGPVKVMHLLSIEWVVLRNLHASDAPGPDGDFATLTVMGGVGKTWVEDCSFGAPSASAAAAFPTFTAPAASMLAGNAFLIRSTFHGGAGRHGRTGGAGLSMTTGNVWAHGCSFVGGVGADAGTSGAPGVLQDGGFLSVAGSLLRGGDGADASASAGGCVDGADGGHGALLVGNSPVHEAHDLTLVGGAGGDAAACGAPGADGRPRLVTVIGLVTDFPGPAVAAELGSPVVAGGGALALELTGAPGDVVLLRTATYPQSIDVPSTIGWLLIGEPAGFLDRVVLPPSGAVTKSYPAPAFVHHGLPSQVLFVQPVAVRPFAGGPRIVHGAPSAVGILGSTL